MPRRVLSDLERLAWASYVEHVTRLSGALPLQAPDLAPSPELALARPAPLLIPKQQKPHRLAPLEVGSAPDGVDRATWARFRTGKLAPSRTLDLHGRTAQRAHADLRAFLGQATAAGLRCVEVITGRGSGEHGGVIRREFPLWLNDPALRPTILAASHPHPANPGSVRLLLRRVR